MDFDNAYLAFVIITYFGDRIGAIGVQGNLFGVFL